MKNYSKVIIVMLVAILGAGVANAQIRFGVKAGLNLNSIHFNDAAKTFGDDNKCGYTLGVMTEFTVPVVGICLDGSLMYTRMNTEITEAQHEKGIGKNFLEIPINLKYKFQLPLVSKVFTPYLLTGPAFAIKLGKTTFDEISTKRCQTAWNVGVGAELMSHLQIQGSYGFGMNHIGKFVGAQAADVKARNNYWTVTAAWLF